MRCAGEPRGRGGEDLPGSAFPCLRCRVRLVERGQLLHPSCDIGLHGRPSRGPAPHRRLQASRPPRQLALCPTDHGPANQQPM